MAFQLNILHLSDLHARHSSAADVASKSRHLGPSFLHNLDQLADLSSIDLVCMTGDVAWQGKPGEYDEASEFFSGVLEHLGLPRSRFLVVPGNHDVDRSLCREAWTQWQRGVDRSDETRAAVLGRQFAFRQWLKSFHRAELLPTTNCGLGYRTELLLPGLPFPVHVLGLDSGWLSGDGETHGALFLTDEQVVPLCEDELPGLRLALIHHPLGIVTDGSEARSRLSNRVDMVLRGHMHEPTADWFLDATKRVPEFVAGCLYEGGRVDPPPITCALITVTTTDTGRPLSFETRARTFSLRLQEWIDQTISPLGASMHPGRIDLGSGFVVGKSLIKPPPKVFVGRQQEHDWLLKQLVNSGPANGNSVKASPVALWAKHVGCGVSTLAENVVQALKGQFPGGQPRVFVDPRDERPLPERVQLALEQVATSLRVLGDEDTLADSVRRRLQHPRTLLHVSGLDNERAVQVATQLAAQLPDCPILLSGHCPSLGSSSVIPSVSLPPWDVETALEQLAREWRPVINDAETGACRELVCLCGYLPLAIHLCAGALRTGYGLPSLIEAVAQACSSLSPEPTQRALGIIEACHMVGLRFLAQTLDQSSQKVRNAIGGEDIIGGSRFTQCLRMLSWAVQSGVGDSLGSGITGLPKGLFAHLMAIAEQHALVERRPLPERPEGVWQLHPLLAQHHRSLSPKTADPALANLMQWFLTRLPGHRHPSRQGALWAEVQAEVPALCELLLRLKDIEVSKVAVVSTFYANHCGPIRPWVRFFRRHLKLSRSKAHDHNAQKTLVRLLTMSGALSAARRQAEEWVEQARIQRDERRTADAYLALADILSDLGEFGDVERLLKEQVVPRYQRLNLQDDVRRAHLSLGDLYWRRDDNLAALRIYQDEVLPKIPSTDRYALAVVEHRLASIAKERQDYNEARRICEERTLPVFTQMADLHSIAANRGTLASVCRARGELEQSRQIIQEEVLPLLAQVGASADYARYLVDLCRIFRKEGQTQEAIYRLETEVMPMLMSLGSTRSLASVQVDLADLLVERNAPGDREAALALLDAAVSVGRKFDLPVLKRAQWLLRKHNLARSPLPLDQVVLQHVRGITHLTLPLDPRLTVLLGRNASGKSTVLDAIAAGLSPIAALRPGHYKRELSDQDLHTEWSPSGQPRIERFARVTLHGHGVIWDISRQRTVFPGSSYSNTGVGVAELQALLEPSVSAILDGNGADERLPIVAYYGVERASNGGSRVAQDGSRLDGLVGALEGRIQPEAVAVWFASLDARERQEQVTRRDFGYRLPDLTAVRGVLACVLPECQNPRTLQNPLRLVVDFQHDGKTDVLELGQLSDGYRAHLSMVLDLARRMLQANPMPLDRESIQTEDEDETQDDVGVCSKALVLIDELELHLHPRWQQGVLPKLLQSFPNTQFIITTHSPQILSGVRREQVRVLADFRLADVDLYVEGRDSNGLLEDVFGVPSRPLDVQARLDELFGLLDRGLYEEVRRQLLSLEAQLGSNDSALVRARWVLEIETGISGNADSEKPTTTEPG